MRANGGRAAGGRGHAGKKIRARMVKTLDKIVDKEDRRFRRK
jgi:hypothetical protein